MNSIADWEARNKVRRDAYIKGSSALTTAIARCTLNEAYATLGHTCVNVLNDFLFFSTQ